MTLKDNLVYVLMKNCSINTGKSYNDIADELLSCLGVEKKEEKQGLIAFSRTSLDAYARAKQIELLKELKSEWFRENGSIIRKVLEKLAELKGGQK